jgi:hypothetical protein
MKLLKGFSIIEILVATGILIVVLGTCSALLTQAEHTTEAAALGANPQENLRAGLDMNISGLLIEMSLVSIEYERPPPCSDTGPELPYRHRGRSAYRSFSGAGRFIGGVLFWARVFQA